MFFEEFVPLMHKLTMTIHDAKWVFLQSNELNALFNIIKLVTQMVKTLGNILYLKLTNIKIK